jgi:hypothetical protein
LGFSGATQPEIDAGDWRAAGEEHAGVIR